MLMNTSFRCQYPHVPLRWKKEKKVHRYTARASDTFALLTFRICTIENSFGPKVDVPYWTVIPSSMATLKWQLLSIGKLHYLPDPPGAPLSFFICHIIFVRLDFLQSGLFSRSTDLVVWRDWWWRPN